MISSELLARIKAEYKIENLELFQMISENPCVYRGVADEKNVFLKIKHEENANHRNDSYISGILEQFRDREVKTTHYLLTKNGSFCMNTEDYLVELQEWVDSQPYFETDQAFASVIRMLSTELAIMAGFKEGLPEADERKIDDYLNNAKFGQELFDYMLNKFLPDDKELIEEACRVLDSMQGKVMKEIGSGKRQWIHADFNLKNIGFEDGKAKVLYDFERVKIGSAAEDIASCLFELCIKDTRSEEISMKIDKFEREASQYGNLSYSLGTLLYVICRRMIRHIYRGLERKIEGNDVYVGFYEVFLEGLKKTYRYLCTFVEKEEEKELSQHELEMSDVILDISNRTLRDVERFVQIIKNEDSFDEVFKLCCKHKIISNLYFHIIHQKLCKYIKKYYLLLLNNCNSYTREYQEHVYQEFDLVNKAFLDANIRYACIKGVSVSKRYYSEDDLIRRDFSDMDFLVSEKDLGKAERILKSMGYGRGFYDYETKQLEPVDRSEIITCRTCTHQIYPFVKPMPTFRYSAINVFKIDINFSIFFGGKIPDEISTDKMLEQVDLVKSKEGEFPVLTPEYEVIQYGYHFYKDTVYTFKNNGLKYVLVYLRDLHMMLENPKFRIECLYEILEQTSISRTIYSVIADVYCCYGGENAKSICEEKIGTNLVAIKKEVAKRITRIN